MLIHKCDRCKKEQKSYNLTSVSVMKFYLPVYELCNDCLNELKMFLKAKEEK